MSSARIKTRVMLLSNTDEDDEAVAKMDNTLLARKDSKKKITLGQGDADLKTIDQLGEGERTKFYLYDEKYVYEGCRGLDEQFEHTPEGHHLMYRGSTHQLIEDIKQANESGSPEDKIFLLHGGPGVGKSVTASQLVHWGRASGWLVGYIPQASWFCSNSGWIVNTHFNLLDTPETCGPFIQSFKAANEELLSKGPIALPTGGTLQELLEEGEEAFDMYEVDEKDRYSPVVDVACRIITALETIKDVNTMLVVDEYNALYGPSEYFKMTSEYGIKMHDAQSLRFVKRLTTPKADSKCIKICATSASSDGITENTKRLPVMKRMPKNALYTIPVLTQAESAAYAKYMWSSGVGNKIRKEAPETVPALLHGLSGGNFLELRKCTTGATDELMDLYSMKSFHFKKFKKLASMEEDDNVRSTMDRRM